MTKFNNISPEEKLRRRQTNFLATLERRVVPGLVQRMPGWVTPDILTVSSVFAAFGVAIVLALGASGVITSFLVGVFLFLHWYFDSTDGALAEYRKQSRGVTGFLIDRGADTLSFSMIFVGFGLSPWLDLNSGVLLALCFCIHQAASVFFTLSQRVAIIGLFGFGATEARLALWLCIAIQVHSNSAVGQTLVFGMLLERFIPLALCAAVLSSSVWLTIRAILSRRQ